MYQEACNEFSIVFRLYVLETIKKNSKLLFVSSKKNFSTKTKLEIHIRVKSATNFSSFSKERRAVDLLLGTTFKREFKPTCAFMKRKIAQFYVLPKASRYNHDITCHHVYQKHLLTTN